MAALGVVNVIGVVAGLLNIVSFTKENFAEPSQNGSVVRIQLGLDSPGGLTGSGGDLPDVRLWNEAGSFLGVSADPRSIKDGTFGDIYIKQSAEQQATYGLITATDNAICIATLSIVWPDEQKFGWTGDWARECGLQWYYSNIVMSGSKENPLCMWIDANHDQPVTAFQLHFPEFVSKDGKFDHNSDYYCNNGIPFQAYYGNDPKSILFGSHNKLKARSKRIPDERGPVNSLPSWRSKRQSSPPSSFNDTRLVISSQVSQSATELCAHSASLGPDFLNVAEGKFCQMSSKTLYPVCDDVVTDNCFNGNTQKLVIGGVSARDMQYSDVLDWTTTTTTTGSSS